MKEKDLCIAVIQGGNSVEKEISYSTAKTVSKALEELGYSYFLLEADENIFQNLQSKKPDIAFVALHGKYGEDGCVQGICEYLKIPYTGSGIFLSSLCMNKISFKKFMMMNKILTPNFQIVDEDFQISSIKKYPVVVKSSCSGSSIGVFIVKDSKSLKESISEAKKLGSLVFIEDYISNNKEIVVSILNGKILSPIELRPKGGVYDYKRKYEVNQTKYIIPPELDPFVVEKIKYMSKNIIDILDLKTYARFDFLVENEKIIWLIELNTLPGLTKTSLLPKSAKYDGISFNELVEKILERANTDYFL